MSTTPKPWVYGHWTIYDQDRGAQERGEPYWTLVEGGDSHEALTLAQGPAGRKAINPDHIIDTCGYECEGIEIDADNARLIEATPELLELLRQIGDRDWESYIGPWLENISTLLAKIDGRKEGQ